jgi:hypothetical protein
MNGQRSRRYHPAVKARLGNNALTVKEADTGCVASESLVRSSHVFPPFDPAECLANTVVVIYSAIPTGGEHTPAWDI